MYFLDKRAKVICEELKKLKVKQKFTIGQWKYKEGNYIHPADAQAADGAWEDFDCQHMHWYGKDRHYWFKTVYKVPEELDGKRMWLHVRVVRQIICTYILHIKCACISDGMDKHSKFLHLFAQLI